ncbi:MAG: methylenetetrahydrofolate reductase [Clostridia bacterium]|nr:methylenetetrahydrofolate reductase [NAD(P)H] [Clostridia bacterium]
MNVAELLNSKKITLSCELFPPKSGSELTAAKQIVAEMAKLSPDYMSVTYGAGGTNCDNFIDVANEVQNINGVTALAHLTCVASEKDKIRQVLTQLKGYGIRNILALRGDMPSDGSGIPSKSFSHACDLMKEIRDFGGFCIGGACYPEGHPEAKSLDKDIEYLKLKEECGCEFLTSQMFFDNDAFYSFMYKLLRAGITIPVTAGIMPVTNARQIKRMCQLSGAQLPREFRAIVERFGDNPDAMRQAGIAYATEQIIDLFANGINNVHIYSMNNPKIAGSIMANLSSIIGD